MGIITHAVFHHFVDRAVVGHQKTIEAPLMTQHSVDEPTVAGRGNAVNQIKRRHHRTHTSLDCGLIGREILVVHAHTTHINRVIITASLSCTVEGVMLQTGHRIVWAIVALNTLYHGLGDATAQERIFACALSYTTPAGIEGNVHHRTVNPVDALRCSLAGGKGSASVDGCGIPTARLREGNRQYSLETMNDVVAKKQGDTQPALFHGYLLQLLDFLGVTYTEHRTKVTVGSQAGQRTIHHLTGDNVAARQQVELTDFFLKRHAAHQFLNEGVHVGSRKTHGRCDHERQQNK